LLLFLAERKSKAKFFWEKKNGAEFLYGSEKK
jgi:hypothetical protein